MSVIAAALRELMAAGIEGEALAAAVERIEAAQVPTRTARQNRNARYYQSHKEQIKAKASESRLNASEPSEASEPPLPQVKVPPDPPKTQPLTPSDEDEEAGARKPHRLSKNHRVTESDREFARERGWTEDEINDGEAEFVDYWANPSLPSSKALKRDWSATWRNRVRDMGQRRGRTARGPPNGQPSLSLVTGASSHVQADSRKSAFAEELARRKAANPYFRGSS
jgi:type IV secretory pathway VirB10-like protein